MVDGYLLYQNIQKQLNWEKVCQGGKDVNGCDRKTFNNDNSGEIVNPLQLLGPYLPEYCFY